jgi:hypothetical protein
MVCLMANLPIILVSDDEFAMALAKSIANTA